MSQDDLYINGELLRLGREARGWVIGDMATRACMSVKQIRQLEEGGTSAFYSPAVKMTSAKKLAGILELSTEQVFKRPGAVEAEPVASQVAEAGLEYTENQTVVTQEAAHTQLAVVIETEAPALVDLSTKKPVAEESKGKTSVWAIAGLFVAAIGVAAYMQQQEEPVTEPPPPLQVLPAEAEPAASAASAADEAASNASAPAERVAAPAASAPLVSAPTNSHAASAAGKPL